MWQPFLDWIAAAPQDYRLTGKPVIADTAARNWWDAEFRKKYTPDDIISDPRPGANPRDFWWNGNRDEAGAFWRGFETLWLPASLLSGDQQQRLADALYGASRHWSFEIQFDKGLAGAPDDALAASRNTATNPAVLTAFGLALIGSFGPPAYPGIPGYAPNLTKARGEATMIANAMGELRKVAPEPAAYVSESNFFEKDWPRSYWGTNYERLVRSNDTTIRTAFSLSITVSAARTGTTVLKGVPRISRRRPWVSAVWSRSNHGEDRLRRIFLIAAQSGEGPLSQPAASVQLRR